MIVFALISNKLFSSLFLFINPNHVFASDGEAITRKISERQKKRIKMKKLWTFYKYVEKKYYFFFSLAPQV